MKLLYAEDEEEMSEAVVDILTYHKYTVDAVYDGEEALSYAHAEQYDGIILDVMMPKKSGLQVLKELRAEGCKTPILLLTAKAEVEDTDPSSYCESRGGRPDRRAGSRVG